MVLASKVEFMQVSNYLRLYFDNKNILVTEESNYILLRKEQTLSIHSWDEYKYCLKTSHRYPPEPDWVLISDEFDTTEYEKYKLFEWISSLSSSPMSNATFLVVCARTSKEFIDYVYDVQERVTRYTKNHK